MRIARVVFFTRRLASYRDVVAVLVQQYQPQRIEIAFPDGRYGKEIPSPGREQSAFIDSVHTAIATLGQELAAYRAAESVDIVPSRYQEEDLGTLLHSTDVIDVTTVPKKLTVQLVTEALKRGGPRVCALTWLRRIEEGQEFRVGRDAYDYLDLTRLEQAAELRRSYAARASLLIGVGAGIFLVSILAVLGRWFPSLTIANEVLVAISVVVGFAGLYVAVKAR